MKKLLYLIPLAFVFLLSFSACGDDEETVPNPEDLEMMLVDAEGNNLLDPDNNLINIDGAKLLFDGKEYPLIDKSGPSLQVAIPEVLSFGFYKLVRFVNDDYQILLVVTPFKSLALNKEHKLTIDWGNGSSDVIKLSYTKISDTEYSRSIYLNDKPCEDGVVKIVKERP